MSIESPELAKVSADSEISPEQSRWGVLRHKHFRRVFFAAFVSNVGGWMEMLGIQMIVAHATGSLTMLGYLGAAQMAPVLVFGLLGGLVADRVNRKKLLVVTQFLLMLVAAAVAIVSTLPLTDTVRVNWLLLLAALNGTVMAFNVPAWQVLTPRLVPRAELTRAITANGVQFNLSRVIGPALAGVFLGWYGATPLFVLNTFTFVAVLIAVSFTPDAPAAKPTGESWRTQMGTASRFTFGQRGPLAILCAMVLLSTLAAPLIRMLPLYVIDVYGVSGGPVAIALAGPLTGSPAGAAPVAAVAAQHTVTGAPDQPDGRAVIPEVKAAASTNSEADRATGLLVALLGLGAVCGGLMLRRVPPWYPKHHFIPMAVAGCGLAITAFAFTTTLWAGSLVIFICGIFWIWGFNQSWAAMQNAVPDSMRGRVMAIANVASFGGTAFGNVASGWLGDALAGPLGKAMGTHLAVGVMSFILLIAGVVMLANRVPEIDGLPRRALPRHLRRGLLNALLAAEHRPAGAERARKSE